jgi:hypothetical protein
VASFGYLQDAGTIVMALKSEKVETNQITALVESSAFPRAAVAAESGLASERPEAESGRHKMNADHVTGCFGPMISTASGVQLQKGTKLMNAGILGPTLGRDQISAS